MSLFADDLNVRQSHISAICTYTRPIHRPLFVLGRIPPQYTKRPMYWSTHIHVCIFMCILVGVYNISAEVFTNFSPPFIKTMQFEILPLQTRIRFQNYTKLDTNQIPLYHFHLTRDTVSVWHLLIVAPKYYYYVDMVNK